MAITVADVIQNISGNLELSYLSDVRPSIYEEMRIHAPYDYKPRYLYFYYVTVEDDGRLSVKHYEYPNKDNQGALVPIEWDDVEVIVTNLTENARSPTDNNPAPLPDRNFRNVSWRRRCYVVILFDEKYWRLFKKGRDNPPVVFLNKSKGDRIGNRNHTFFDGKDLEISIGGGETRSAIAFINHHRRNEIGERITNTDHQYFWFNIYVDVAFSQGDDPKMVMIFDPGGTNDGPPVDP